MNFQRIAIIGAGSWGTALAVIAQRAGRDVVLCARDSDRAKEIAARRESPLLPGIRLDAQIAVTDSLKEAAAADALLLAVPAQSARAAMTAIAPHLGRNPVVSCAKGIEQGTGKFMSEVVAECAPRAIPAVLSGPSFAADAARGLPTAVTIAAADGAVAAALARALGSQTFRPYHATDMRGAEIGGAAKNVLAIAAGIVAGCELGPNTIAALTTRGFAELMRFGRACGAQPETLMGLSGLGDVILSCSGPRSRNFALGAELGRGRSPAQAQAAAGLAEGFFTASALETMARRNGVDMPIVSAVAAVLAGKLQVADAIDNLLMRPLRAEG